MTDYVDLSFDADANAVIGRILDAMAALMPGWSASDGDPGVVLAYAFGAELFRLAQIAANAGTAGVLGFAAALGYTPRAAVTASLQGVRLHVAYRLDVDPATVSSVSQVVSEPARGFTIQVGDASFATTADVAELVELTWDAGMSQWVGAVTVDMAGLTPGTAGNMPAGAPVTILTATGRVYAVELTEPGVGGVDAQSTAEFLAEFVTHMRLLRVGGVTVADMAALALSVPGVQRALGIDLLDPSAPGVQTPRACTVIAVDAAGQAVTGAVADALLAALQAAREVNFLVFLAPPVYTPIDITMTVRAADGVDAATAHDAAAAAVAEVIDPATWGTTKTVDAATGAVSLDAASWTERTDVTTWNVAAAVDALPQIAEVLAITVTGTPLAGPGALPAPVGAGGSTITVTVQ